ncbi:MAG: hypothetical protein VCD00_07305 [Candidatus Hydrogenedentota bacterium]
MTSSTDIIDKAIDMAAAGEAADATRLLWPLMASGEQDDQALFALAFCFEKANNFATANYLYGVILESYPDFESAIARQVACKAVVFEKGLIEDFTDLGHRKCGACRLRYRSEHMLCPYCGTDKDAEDSYEDPDFDTEEIPPGWKDPSLLETLQDMGRDAADRIQDVVESDAVQDFSKKVSSAAQSSLKKAKEYSERENVKEVTDRGAEIGKDFVGKAEKLTENSTIRDVAQKIEDLSWKASDAMKDLITGNNDSGREDSERNDGGDALEKAKEAGKSILRKIRDLIDPDKGKG